MLARSTIEETYQGRRKTLTFDRGRINDFEKGIMVRKTGKLSKTRRVAASIDNDLLNTEDPHDSTEEDVLADMLQVETEPRLLATEQRVFQNTSTSELPLLLTKTKNSKIKITSADEEGVPNAKKTKFSTFSTKQQIRITATKRMRKPVNKFSPSPQTQIPTSKLDPLNPVLETTAAMVQSNKCKKCISSVEVHAENIVSVNEETSSCLPQATAIQNGPNKKNKYCRSTKQISQKKTNPVSLKEVDEIQSDSDTPLRVTRYASKLQNSLNEEPSTLSYQKTELNIQRDPNLLQNRTNYLNFEEIILMGSNETESNVESEGKPKMLANKSKRKRQSVGAEEILSMGSHEMESNVESEGKLKMLANKSKRKKQSVGAEEILPIGSLGMESNVESEGNLNIPANKSKRKKKYVGTEEISPFGSHETESNVESQGKPNVSANKSKRKKNSVGAEETSPMGRQKMESNVVSEGKPNMPIKHISKKIKHSNFTAEETLSIRSQEIGSSMPNGSNQTVQGKKKKKIVSPQTPKGVKPTKQPKKAKSKCGKSGKSRSTFSNQIPEELKLTAAVLDRRDENEDTTVNVPSESFTPRVPKVVIPKKKCGLNKGTSRESKKKTALVKKKWLNPNPPTIIKARPKKLSIQSTTLREIPVESTNNESSCLPSTNDKFESNKNTKESTKRKSVNNNEIIKIKIPFPINKNFKSKKPNSQPIATSILDSAKFEKPRPVPMSPKMFYNVIATDECSGSSLITVSTLHSWANISSTTSKSGLVPIDGKIPTLIIPKIDKGGSFPRQCTLTDTTTSTSQTDSSSTNDVSTSDTSKTDSTTTSNNYSDLIQCHKLDLSISTADESEELYTVTDISSKVKATIKFDESSHFLEKFRVPLSYFVNLKNLSSENAVGDNKMSANSTRLKGTPKLQDNSKHNVEMQFHKEKNPFTDNEKHVKTKSASNMLNIAKPPQNTEKHVEIIPSSDVLNNETLQPNKKPMKAIHLCNVLNTATLQHNENQVKTKSASNMLNTLKPQQTEMHVKTIPSSDVLNNETLQPNKKPMKVIHSSNVLNTASVQYNEKHEQTKSTSKIFNTAALQQIKRTFNTFDMFTPNPDTNITKNATAGSTLYHNQQDEKSTKFDRIILTTTNEMAPSREDEPRINKETLTRKTFTKAVSTAPSSQSNTSSTVSSHPQKGPTENVPVSSNFLPRNTDTQSEHSDDDVLSLAAESVFSDVYVKRPSQRQKFVCEKQNPDSTSLQCSTMLASPEDTCDLPLPELNSKTVPNASPSRKDDNSYDEQPSLTENVFMFKGPDYVSKLFFNICTDHLTKQCSNGKGECEFYHIPNKHHMERLKQILSKTTSCYVIINEYLSMRDLLFGRPAFVYYAQHFMFCCIQKQLGQTLVEIMLDIRKAVGPTTFVHNRSLSALNTGTMKGNCYPLYLYALEDGRKFVHILLESISNTTDELANITKVLLRVLIRIKEPVEYETALRLIKKTCNSENLHLIKAMYEYVIGNTSSEIFSEKDLLKKYATVLLKNSETKLEFKRYYDVLVMMVPDLNLSEEDVNRQNATSTSEKVCTPEVTANSEGSPALHCTAWKYPFVLYNGNPPRINGHETTQHTDLMKQQRPNTPGAAPQVWKSQVWRQQGPSIPFVRPQQWNTPRWRPPRTPFQKGPRF